MTKEKDYFDTFCALSQVFATAATVDELLQLIVSKAKKVMEAKAACLFLTDRKQDVFIPNASFGLSEQYMHTTPIRAKKLIGALKNKGALYFEDATSDPRLEHHEAKKQEGIASILTVGVIVDDQLIGLLSIYTATTRSFNDQEIVFLKALAATGGIALKKARLLERIENNSRLILELTSAVNSSLEIQDVLHTMTERTGQALGMKGVTIRLLDERKEALKLVASYGLSEAFLEKGPISADKSITGALGGETIILENLENDRRLQYPKQTKKEGIKSIVCIPLKAKENVLGVMRLYSDTPRRYTQDFISVVEAIAQAGTLAIQNASMYLLLKEDKRILEEEIWHHRLYF